MHVSFTVIFDVVWLMGLLVLLILIWRSSERRADQTQKTLEILVEVTQKNAESAWQAIQLTKDTLQLLEESIHK